jgi:mono/diheme cytochrome c family protein
MKKMLVAIPVLLLVLLGVYQALMFYDNQFPLGRMRETPAVRPHERPILIMDEAAVPTGGGEALYKTAAPTRLTSPIDMTAPTAVENGKTVYFTYCHQCHGSQYDGNGTVGQSFAPRPRDLQSERVQTRSAGELFHEISYGIPGGRQPALATTIDITERWQVVAYVQSLGTRK